MRVKNKIFYQVATNRNFKVGDRVHFGEETNGQMKIFDFSFNENGKPFHELGFKDAKRGIFKNKTLIYKLSNALANYDLYLRETALEEVRKEKFPNLPSRFKCMFLSETKEDALKNMDIMLKRGQGEQYQVIAVKVTGEIFYVKEFGLGRFGVSFNEYKKLAEKYWTQNQKSGARIKEILFMGDAEVVEIIKDSQEQ